jgi:CRISPR/Cas system-associated exonuclease Cas4 (RecB family)
MLNLSDRIRDAKEAKRKITPCTSNRASMLGDECTRKLVYWRLNWAEAQKVNPELQAIFDDGKNSERSVMDDLREAGIYPHEQQIAFGSENLFRKYNITGHLDAVVLDDKGHMIPVEVKQMHPMIAEKIRSIQDMLSAKQEYIRKYPIQLALYMLAKNAPYGIFLIKSKGIPRQINLTLDEALSFAERALKQAEEIEKHVKTVTYPTKKIGDRCQNCPFNHLCLPGRDFGQILSLVDDNELESLLKQREELESDAKEYKRIDKQVKDIIKAKGKEKLMIGDFYVEVSEYETSVFIIPDSVKSKYKMMEKRSKISIQKLKEIQESNAS